jgi:hypothetical protein
MIFVGGSPARMSRVVLFCHTRSALQEEHLIDRRMSKHRHKLLSHCLDACVLTSSRKVIGRRNHIRFIVWVKWPCWVLTRGHVSSAKSHYLGARLSRPHLGAAVYLGKFVLGLVGLNWFELVELDLISWFGLVGSLVGWLMGLEPTQLHRLFAVKKSNPELKFKCNVTWLLVVTSLLY